MSLPHAATRSAIIAAALLCLAACGGEGGSAATPASGNSAPAISGQPVTTIGVGDAYFFQPTADDADGDTLEFSASNLPRWASFDPATGRIVGAPGAAEVGNYPAIVIAVSDGKTRVALSAFEIAVTATGSGVATLSWLPPVENVDDSPLTDLARYRIRYGHDPDTLDRSVEIENPSLTRYVVENLGAGTWYFAIVVVKASGVESALSNLVAKTVR